MLGCWGSFYGIIYSSSCFSFSFIHDGAVANHKQVPANIKYLFRSSVIVPVNTRNEGIKVNNKPATEVVIKSSFIIADFGFITACYAKIQYFSHYTQKKELEAAVFEASC